MGAGSDAAEATSSVWGGLAADFATTDANCSAGRAGLAGGNGTIATFSTRDSATATADGFSDRASGAGAGLREITATLTGAGAAAVAASCASGMRGQWRTLPVSMCTKGAPDVG